MRNRMRSRSGCSFASDACNPTRTEQSVSAVTRSGIPLTNTGTPLKYSYHRSDRRGCRRDWKQPEWPAEIAKAEFTTPRLL